MITLSIFLNTMVIVTCIFMSVLLRVADGLTVRGPSAPLVAPLGSSVVLPCFVDDSLLIEEVEWRRTDSWALVHLYQNGKSRPEAQQQDYHDRAHFFTEEIQHGNFSLHLGKLRAEDEGEYTCEVNTLWSYGRTLVQIKVIRERLWVSGSESIFTYDGVSLPRTTEPGFSSWHIAVLFFCSAAGSGALLLLCTLICCRSKNTDTISTIWKLQFSLVFFSNICLSFAFLIWGLTEESLDETVICCALYILRPLMLIWTLPCLKYLQGNPKPCISFFTITREFAIFTIVVFSVIFSDAWKIKDRFEHISELGIGVLFGIVVLLCLILSTEFAIKRVFIFYSCIFFLSVSQLLQLGFLVGFFRDVVFFHPPNYFVVIMCCALLLSLLPFLLHLPTVLKCLRRKCTLLLWIITISLLEIIIVVYICLFFIPPFFIFSFFKWICVFLFLDILKMIVIYTFEKREKLKKQQQTEESQQGSNSYHLCHEIMYMFGAVGVVLLSSVTLVAEVIMGKGNGERVIEDLRIIVIPSECAFALYCLVLEMHAYWKVFTRPTHSRQLETTEESHEMEILSAADSPVDTDSSTLNLEFSLLFSLQKK